MSTQIVCPHCNQVGAVPAGLSGTFNCHNCGQPFTWGAPPLPAMLAQQQQPAFSSVFRTVLYVFGSIALISVILVVAIFWLGVFGTAAIGTAALATEKTYHIDPNIPYVQAVIEIRKGHLRIKNNTKSDWPAAVLHLDDYIAQVGEVKHHAWIDVALSRFHDDAGLTLNEDRERESYKTVVEVEHLNPLEQTVFTSDYWHDLK